MPQPDNNRPLSTIAYEEPHRVPLAEFGVDTALKDRFMGRPVRTLEDHPAFQVVAGFDFIYHSASRENQGARAGWRLCGDIGSRGRATQGWRTSVRTVSLPRDSGSTRSACGKAT